MFRANHAFAIKDFLEKFRRNPAINISSAGYLTYILWALKLKGDEKRPLTEDEVRQLLCRYSFFGSYLTRLGLWINQPEIHKYFLSRIILHIPHSSFRIPFPDGYAAKAAALLKEQLLLTDLFTDDLFNHPDTIRVIADFSRVFCDVERFPDGADPRLSFVPRYTPPA
jgi:hypothetical protein